LEAIENHDKTMKDTQENNEEQRIEKQHKSGQRLLIFMVLSRFRFSHSRPDYMQKAIIPTEIHQNPYKKTIIPMEKH